MRLWTYYRKSISHHWRSHLAVGLGVAAAAATLTGALLVGDAMRGSLRDMALQRLGPVHHALVARRFFRESLAAEVAGSEHVAALSVETCPLVLVDGSASHADTQARVNRITVFGVDRRYWSFGSGGSAGASEDAGGEPRASGRSVILNQPLAEELGAVPGDDVMIRLAVHGAVPVETLFGRRDDLSVTLRLTVESVVPGQGMGGLGLRPAQYAPRNAFIPLRILQLAMKRSGRVNAILATGGHGGDSPREDRMHETILRLALQAGLTLADYGLQLRRDDVRGYVALESDRLLIEPNVEAAALDAADALGIEATGVLTYLANTMALLPASAMATAPRLPKESLPKTDTSPASQDGDRTGTPYSTVSAIDLRAVSSRSPLVLAGGQPAPVLEGQDLLLNAWAAEDLGAKPGDRLVMTYYVSQPFGRLEEAQAVFTVRGIVRMEGWAADPHMTPEYEGMTDAENLSDWDPPFPIDMSRIREKDERYWDEHRATPKAFIALRTGQELWAGSEERFGRLTSIRFRAAADEAIVETAALESALLDRLTPGQVGLTFEPVRQQALAASRGGTNFGALFLGFSFFLIASAAMLVALLFRLGVEQRATEIGTLLATGFNAAQVTKMLLSEGALVAGIGAAVGLVAANGYAWLMLAGLRSWWADAVNAPFLALHSSPSSFVIGFLASFLIAMIAIVWAVRGLTRLPPRALLAGVVSAGRPSSASHRRVATVAASVLFGGALLLAAAAVVSDAVPETGAFFGSGTALLGSMLVGLWVWYGRDRTALIRRPGIGAIVRLGLRNAVRQRRRSLLSVGLIASAAFLIVAVGANRHGTPVAEASRESPTGGFALLAEAVIPLPYDLNTAEGRESLGLADATADLLEAASVVSFRRWRGEDASCLNLYKVRRPHILGAPDRMIDRGGFEFHASIAQTPEQTANPWTLLRRTFDDGAIPAIGDTNTVKWLLHLGLGRDLVVADEAGAPLRLRIVGMLAGSVLQGELVISEARFTSAYPSISGYSFFLVESTDAEAWSLKQALERDLHPFGVDAVLTTDRLDAYLAVENTYLSTFQTLGGLGLLLGTFGLAAVMLRNMAERRGELALLRAVGYRRSALGWMVLAEHGALLLTGLVAGSVSALLAVAPHALSNANDVPWLSLGGTLLVIFIAGMTAGAAALLSALRAPLLPALRSE